MPRKFTPNPFRGIRGWLTAASLLLPLAAHAQYTDDFQTNIISGVTSNWTGDYFVGSTNFADVLIVDNGGVLSNTSGYIGYTSSSSNNISVVTGTGSVWNNSSVIVVGNSGTGNSLVISNGGRVFSGPAAFGVSGYVGGTGGGSGNNVLVTGIGSVWSNRTDLVIGVLGKSNNLAIVDGGQVFSRNGIFEQPSGAIPGGTHGALVSGSGSVWNCSGTLSLNGDGNGLVISNGGRVACFASRVGSESNSVLVSGAGSVWSNRFDLFVGYGFSGGSHSLIIADGGQVVDNTALVGDDATSSNSARVLNGGVWQNSTLIIGYQGAANSLVITSGAVTATSVIIGVASTTCDNLLELDSGSLTVTNSTTNAVLEVRNGSLILNDGTLQADKLVITNACARLTRSGGTLIVSSLVLDPALDADGDGLPNGWEQMYGLDPLSTNDVNGANGDADGDGVSNTQEFQAGSNPVEDIKSIAQEGDDIRVTWSAAAGKTNALQAGDGDGDSYTNDFSDIFTVTNMVDSPTNFLDIGAATNVPSRYYRIRLVP